MLRLTVIALLALATVNALPSIRQKSYKSLMPRIPVKEGTVIPQRPDGKIVGGDLASQGQFPYQAAVSIDNAYFCGGSLIAADWVLCAAHCTVGSQSIEITMGDLDRSDTSGLEQVRNSANIITHEDYPDFVRIVNDVSVIQVSEPFVEDGENVQRIALASSNPSEGDQVILSGWGKTSDDTNFAANELGFVQVPIAPSANCEIYGNSFDADQQICVDTTGGQGVCNGDSGGPMAPLDQSVVYGIASYVSSAGCASGVPHVFTSVSYYSDWITQQTGV